MDAQIHQRYVHVYTEADTYTLAHTQTALHMLSSYTIRYLILVIQELVILSTTHDIFTLAIGRLSSSSKNS